MVISKANLLAFLKELDNDLSKKINLIAVGGTAMTLLGLKNSTIDIDFDMSMEDMEEFRKTLQAIPHGFRIDIFLDGMVFSQQLPDDYSEKSIPIDSGLKNIGLSALHPLDIVVTKIGRLDERDIEDIEACIKGFSLLKEDIRKRAQNVEYVGREENYMINLQHVLKKIFKSS
ncbi:MAG: hypothetical protein ISS93_03150 [Candidatus Aenigmarchaeota archaeon]|nr:hypothetical protein [Candidatus Aenigmarchaeota archaeon]